MNPILRNILAVIAGAGVGSVINMAVIMISPYIIPPPAGADLTTLEGLKASMHLFEPKHFIMPFLAHALGTFVGAFLATYIAANRKMVFAFLVGVLFLIGGIANVNLLPSPIWFAIVDVGGAYLPVAYLAAKAGSKEQL